MLWMHWRGIIIGNIRDLKVEGAEITGEPYFDEVRDESKLAKQQWDKGTLKMCSPYFEIVESSDDPVLLKPGQTRPTHHEVQADGGSVWWIWAVMTTI